MISASRFIYEIALNLTMIESDPVQTADIPYPPPSHASLTLAPLAINLKCTPVPVADWPTLPLAGLLLAPINADHSRSDFPARDLDFVPPSALRAGCSALRGRRVHRAGEGHLHNLPWSLDRDGRGVIRPGDTGVILLSWCSVIMNRNTLPFNVWKLLLNTKQETIEIAFFLVWYHAMYCWHLQLLRHITFLNDTKFAPAAQRVWRVNISHCALRHIFHQTEPTAPSPACGVSPGVARGLHQGWSHHIRPCIIQCPLCPGRASMSGDNIWCLNADETFVVFKW